MKISEIIKKISLKYNIKKYKRIEIIEFENESLLILIENNKNVFKISRTEFYKFDDLLLPYAICLIDNFKEEIYYMKISEPNNFLRKAFENTQKDEIYFGKEVLQNKILNEEDLIKKIKKIGEY